MTHVPGPASEAEPVAQTTAEHGMLIDRYLPRFDVTLIEHTVIDADVPKTWAALQDFDLLRIHTPLLDAAIFVRGLPDRIAARGGTRTTGAPPTTLKLTGDGPALDGWLPLGAITEREIALGAIGRFWQPAIEWYDVTTMTPEQFTRFEEPGWGRIAAQLLAAAVRPGTHPGLLRGAHRHQRSRLGTQVRALLAAGAAFVRHILRAALDTLQIQTERRTP